MPIITITGTDYPTYTTVAEADTYLAVDVQRATAWAARTTLQKQQGLITATRFLQSLTWASGAAPLTTDDPVASPLPEATAMLAADFLATPALASGGGTGSNVKRAKAGSAEVEFFRPVTGYPMPLDVFTLLRSLLGIGDDGLAIGYGVVSGSDFCSRFDSSDFRIVEPFR